MRRLGLALILVILCLGFDSPQPAATIEPEDGLTGTWDLVDIQIGGFPAPPNQLKAQIQAFQMQLVFHGTGKLEIRTTNQVEQATYQAAYQSRPSTLDIILSTGKAKGERSRGIFEVKGNKLTLCVSERGNRPREFKSTTPDVVIMILERKK